MHGIDKFYFDDILEKRPLRLPFVSVWEPVGMQIVMGASGKLETEVHDNRTNSVNVYKRRGGGGTVVLNKGMLIISILANACDLFNGMGYLRKVNTAIIAALESVGVKGVDHKGISDLAINNKKILGSSLYRKKHILYYQGVLLIDTDIALINEFLRYPRLEPDYRCGRDHLDFITTLRNENYYIDCAKLCDALHGCFNELRF